MDIRSLDYSSNEVGNHLGPCNPPSEDLGIYPRSHTRMVRGLGHKVAWLCRSPQRGENGLCNMLCASSSKPSFYRIQDIFIGPTL